MATIEEDLHVLDVKLKQLRLDYEQYFLGARPREPVMLRGEVQKLIAIWSNQPIQNTACRFKFSSLCSRFLSMKRQWDQTLRKMEEGTYARHVFRARLHERDRAPDAGERAGDAAAPAPATSRAASAPREVAERPLFDAYVEACRSTGQPTQGLTAEKLESVMARQRETLRAQYGCDVRFRVVVEEGRAKLKATPVGGGGA